MKTTLYLLIAGFFLPGCSPSDGVQTLPGEWRVLAIQPTGELPQDAPAEYVIHFKSDGTLHLRLDVNQCFGNYTSNKPGRISISSLGCTEACCDSAFAQRMAQMLNQVTAFEIQGTMLVLDGPEGKVAARRVAE